MNEMKRLQVGDKIWRPCVTAKVAGVRMFLPLEVEFEMTKKKTWLGKAVFNPDCCVFRDPEDWALFDGNCGRGMICFIKEPPIHDWTYGIVKALGKVQTVAFVELVKGSEEEMYSRYHKDEKEFIDRHLTPEDREELGLDDRDIDNDDRKVRMIDEAIEEMVE